MLHEKRRRKRKVFAVDETVKIVHEPKAELNELEIIALVLLNLKHQPVLE